MKTRAAVLTAINCPLELWELEIPPLQRGHVLVHMKYSGLCRSQLNELRGWKGEDPYLPHTLGHEGSGIVYEVGEGVSKVKAGDFVIVTWLKGEGLESSPIQYTHRGRVVNSGAVSTFLEYAVVAENRLVPIPSSVSLREAALFGCAIPTGAGIVLCALQIPEGASIALFGLGGVGLSALLAAVLRVPKTLIAIDIEESKLDLAAEWGATHCINATEKDPLEAIFGCTQARGVDFAIEAAGQKSVMEKAFKSVRDGGGVCVLAGNVPKGVCIECDPFDFIRGKQLLGSWGGGIHPDRDIPFFLKRFEGKKKELGQLISHEAPLEKINSLIALLEERKVMRAMITL